MSLGGRVLAAIKAFREPSLISGINYDDDFSSADNRVLRYALFWSFYENSVYRNIHNFEPSYKHKYALYRYIRNIYNPSYRLGEFWKTHLFGGALDPLAGNGLIVPSAIPILTENEDLRPVISQVWQNSNWQTNKDVMSLYGAIMGDVGVKVIDDPEKQKTYMSVVHPSTITDVTLDAWRNVKGYTIEEERAHPDKARQLVTYKEVAFKDGETDVIFQTFMNDKPFAWNGVSPEWTMPYGFVPLVLIPHNNIGGTWGWSEIQAGQSKFREIDDLASALNDQIRKLVNPAWLFSGVNEPKKSPTATGADATTTKPQPGREEMNALYADKEASATALVAELDIPGVSGSIAQQLAEIERDYPELQNDIWAGSGDVSGRALRIARQRTESKVNQRRANYDDGLERAQKMAVAIGGEQRYKGYEGFTLESFVAGALDHHISNRPVFTVDPLDDLDFDRAFWEVATLATAAGQPLEQYLSDAGWDDEKIEETLAAKAREFNQALEGDLARSSNDNANALAMFGNAVRSNQQPAQTAGESEVR